MACSTCPAPPGFYFVEMGSTDIIPPIPNSYWVIPGRFLAGEHPTAQGLEAARRRLGVLLRAGIDVFVDLVPQAEAVPYDSVLRELAGDSRMDVQYYRFGIADFGIPPPGQMRRTLDTLDLALGQGRKVYLHCWGGIGRTGTTVGCYLVRHGLTGDQALAQLAAWWRTVPKSRTFPRSPETEAQVAYIRNWVETTPS
jgi:protein-tyrosine phosphatase